MKYISRGLKLKCLFVLLLFSSMFAAYIGSWFPLIMGFPAGGIIRDLVILILMIYSVILLFRSKRILRYEFFLVVFWLFYIAWIAILVALDGQKTVAIMGARNLIFFPIVGLLVLINITQGRLSQSTIRKVISIIGIIASILGILDISTQGKIMDILGYRPEYSGSDYTLVTSFLGYGRASGGLADALNYGYTMAIFALYATFHLLVSLKDKSKQKISRTEGFISIVLVSLSSVATFLSLTRGAIIILVIGLILFITRLGSKKTIFILFGLLLVISYMLSHSDYGELVLGRLQQTDKISQSSSDYRIIMAQESLNTVLQSPYGVGLGTQGAGVKKFSNDNRINTDNYFLIIALETGLPGLIIFFLLIIMNFKICFKYSKYGHYHFAMFLVFLISFCISSILSSAPNSPIFAISYWTILNTEAANIIRNRSLGHVL